MRLSSIIQLVREYLVLGVLLSTLLIVIFLLGYFIVYKRIMKGKKKFKIQRVLLYGIFIIYLTAIVGATLLARHGNNQGGVSLQIFSSYMDAWNSFTVAEWRNIILNILMFVPLGFMLPILFKSLQKWYLTYGFGLLLTIFIEVIQLVAGKGIFEIDDIINNTVGCIIGYGLIMLFLLNIKKEKIDSRKRLGASIIFQLPLIITVILFSTIFISYSRLEIGNLSYAASYNVKMNSIEVASNITMDNSRKTASVYELNVVNKEEALLYAKEFLSKLNTEVDENLIDAYDDTVICNSIDGKYSIWVNYLGLTTSFTNFENLNSAGKTGLNKNEVSELLSKYSITIPEGAEFLDKGNGNYTIKVDLINEEDKVFSGELNCTINTNGEVTSFTNGILELKPYKEYEIISEAEAYNKILNGEFKYYGELGEGSKLNIKNVKLKYEIDSKGFYQPVYLFEVDNGDVLNCIIIPAVVK